ncbi:MAG: MBL fold metallo-hydrolase [Sporocytophaga sp.]|uniref:MBL fold metallo-hydrolase n=1 Tax=Sporocytophaga sp. TaxID=2231183 RepID=UPI001AFE3E5A|nr:MBL fold metallo-hydrolase [Sporocytophaga sp.]MBO9700889.1 MBL fold metallo-hydrolase [Sporocytophaga sp.]
MIISFLGTGTSQGIPVIGCDCEVCTSLDFRDKRLRTSIHVQTEDQSIVVDTGPDFRTQALRQRIKNLDAVLITHAHKDHTAGLDDIRAYNYSQKKDMPVYGRLATLEQLKKEFSYAFTEFKYPGVPEITLIEIENKPFSIGKTEITPIEVMHYKMPVFGFRIKDFTYITDANYISDQELEKIKGTKVLILNALQKQEHISHFNLEQALQVVDKIKPQKAYFTHIAHKMGLHRSVETELPANVHLAYDGQVIDMSCI